MTDKEIIKALECCYRKGGTPCRDCPFNKFEDCNDVLMADYVFNLIKRQQAEIERLKIENQAFRSAANSYKLHYNEARTEAVKEFAKRLKKVWWDNRYESPDVDFDDFVDNLVKEIVGDTE